MSSAVEQRNEWGRLAHESGEAARFHKAEVRRHRRLAADAAREHAEYIAKLAAIGINYVEGTATKGHSQDDHR